MLKHKLSKTMRAPVDCQLDHAAANGGGRFSGGALPLRVNILRDIDIGTALECSGQCNHHSVNDQSVRTFSKLISPKMGINFAMRRHPSEIGGVR